MCLTQAPAHKYLGDSDGLTFPGFACLFRLLLERRQGHVVWRVLRRFGYRNDLLLRKSYATVWSVTESQSSTMLRV